MTRVSFTGMLNVKHIHTDTLLYVSVYNCVIVYLYNPREDRVCSVGKKASRSNKTQNDSVFVILSKPLCFF